MKKLDITINGLEYVAKASTQSIEIEQNAIKINRLERDIESLADSNVELQNVINEKLKLINILNERIDELEEDNAELFNENMRLNEALNDIYQVAKDFN